MSESPAAVSTVHVTPSGQHLWWRRFAPAGRARARVLLVHGYLEHGGRYTRFAQALCAEQIAVDVFDLRGHGRSDGPRGHVVDFADYITDVRSMRAQIGDDVPVVLMGHSLGGLIAVSAALECGKSLAGLVLSNPYLANAVPIPAAKRWLGRVATRYWPRLRAPAGMRREWMSKDPAALARMASDPLIMRSATAGWFDQTQRQQARIANVRKLDCPVWLGIGSADPVASPSANQHFGERLLAPDKSIAVYEGALHELLQDTVANDVTRDIARFVLTAMAGR